MIVDVVPSEHVVVVDEEGEIEGEIDERSEHRFSNQEQKVPDFVGDVIGVLQERRDQAALVQQP